ncbi:uncharacterized protein LOC106880171 [Octopus bimaculoides]|uniref:Uncharacterized protein n=1 Tax=Octopus bimaculoides TaxID=37653 RepID=A0A0L8FZV8_OCTBM|nr:uncharacterized protein LOC106880171 [Octopus bimaculoides]|eukprot:XP_014785502.1 PREDICTED: uncharacterized protein LOC106880171 [Octopus bimaculoides]
MTMARKKNKQAYKPPAGGATITPAQVNKTKAPLDSKTEAFVDSLYNATFQRYDARPTSMEGVYIVLRWYKFSKTWITLYVGEGDIRLELNRLFGPCKTCKPITKYLSSVSKADRKRLLALKWIPYPDFKTTMKDIRTVIAAKYNDGGEPPFNCV